MSLAFAVGVVVKFRSCTGEARRGEVVARLGRWLRVALDDGSGWEYADRDEVCGWEFPAPPR